MEDIRLYDLNFELLAIVHRVKSSAWELYYNKPGTFEAHISIDAWLAPAVFDTPYLIAAEGNKQAFVHARQINKEIVLYGKTLNWLLSKRSVMPFNTSRDGIINNPVTLCDKLVTDVFINDRTITDAYGNSIIIPGVLNFEVTDNSADFDVASDEFYRTAAHPLSEVIIDRLANDNLGHRLIADIPAKKWRFEIYSGAECPIVFSKANKTMYDLDFTSDISNVFGAGFYELTQEVDTDTIIDSESTEEDYKEYGFVVNEDYNSVPDMSNAICVWDTVLSGTSPSEALTALSGNIRTEKISGTAAHLEFEKDYNLGDIVRIQMINDGFCRTFTRRVTGVKIYRESSGISCSPILEED